MDDTLVGSQIHQYLIEDRIGGGGTAIVYRAKTNEGRRVAFKILKQDWTQEQDVLKRFTREAQILQGLDHPHIIRYIDSDIHEGRPYIVMEYIRGGSLYDKMRKRSTISLGAAATLLTQIGEALAYAHERQIIHRDLKPGNILLKESGHAVLTDFGIARGGYDQYTQVTMSANQMPGTPFYMSPEQAAGKIELTTLSDVYSLAIIAFLLSTGRLPFINSDPFIVMRQQMDEKPPIPTELNPDLPDALNPVLERALTKSPSMRYQSTEDFVNEFKKAINNYRDVEVTIIARGHKQDDPNTEPPSKLFQTGEFTILDREPAPAQPPTTIPMARPQETRIVPPPDTRRNNIMGIIAIGVLIVSGIIGIGIITSNNNNNDANNAAFAFTETANAITPTETPTETPATPILQLVREDQAIRLGPGSDYPAIATAASAKVLDIIGISEDGAWYQVVIGDGEAGWVPSSSSLVSAAGNLAGLPIAAAPTNTDTPTPTPTDTPTPSETPTQTPSLTPTETPNRTATREARETATQSVYVQQTALVETAQAGFTQTATLWTLTPSLTNTATLDPTLVVHTTETAVAIFEIRATETADAAPKSPETILHSFYNSEMSATGFQCTPYIKAFEYLEDRIQENDRTFESLTDFVEDIRNPVREVYELCVSSGGSQTIDLPPLIFQDMRTAVEAVELD